MSVWERLLQSWDAWQVYRNSPLFRLIVDKTRAAEDVGQEPIIFLGEILAAICRIREAWMKDAVQVLYESAPDAIPLKELDSKPRK